MAGHPRAVRTLVAVYGRFQIWVAAGTFPTLMDTMIAEAASLGQVDLCLVSVDSTVSRAHHHAAGMAVDPKLLAELEKVAAEEKGTSGKRRNALPAAAAADAADPARQRTRTPAAVVAASVGGGAPCSGSRVVRGRRLECGDREGSGGVCRECAALAAGVGARRVLRPCSDGQPPDAHPSWTTPRSRWPGPCWSKVPRLTVSRPSCGPWNELARSSPGQPG